MILFHAPEYAGLALGMRESLGLRRGHWQADRFANGELSVTVDTPVTGDGCAILASITPPDAHLLTTLLLCDTLHREGARGVTLLLPYLAYARQEKPEPGRGLATAWVGAMLAASCADRVVTIDVHSPHVAEVMRVPVCSLSPAVLFASEIRLRGWEEATLVAPDAGALRRGESVAKVAGMVGPVAHCEKKRTPAGVTSTLCGRVGRQAVIVDDILDTGGTLLACCAGLHEAGAEEILVLVTHGLFTGEAWMRLWDLGVCGIVCTDSVPLPARAHDPRIHVVSVLPLLTASLIEEESA